MIDGLVYILKIVYYFAFVFILYWVTSYYYKKQNKRFKGKFPIILIIIFAIIFAIYMIICGKYPYESDRDYYAFTFQKDAYLSTIKSASLGLYWVEIVLHIFTHEPKVLFFLIGILYFVLTMIAYNSEKNATPFALLLLGLTAYYSYGAYLLKQCIAIALISIATTSFFNKKNKFFTIILIILAICFHEAAWVTIPVYLAMYFSKYKKIEFLQCLLLIVCVVFFQQINKFFIDIAIKFVPSISSQLSGYLNLDGSLETIENFETIFKGFPFYFITIWGFIKRKELKNEIDNYDKYLFICLFVSSMIILSRYMYWMYRFATFFYFHSCVFASILYSKIKLSKDKILFLGGTAFIFFVLTLRMWLQYFFLYGGI